MSNSTKKFPGKIIKDRKNHEKFPAFSVFATITIGREKNHPTFPLEAVIFQQALLPRELNSLPLTQHTKYSCFQTKRQELYLSAKSINNNPAFIIAANLYHRGQPLSSIYYVRGQLLSQRPASLITESTWTASLSHIGIAQAKNAFAEIAYAYMQKITSFAIT